MKDLNKEDKGKINFRSISKVKKSKLSENKGTSILTEESKKDEQKIENTENLLDESLKQKEKNNSNPFNLPLKKKTLIKSSDLDNIDKNPTGSKIYVKKRKRDPKKNIQVKEPEKRRSRFQDDF